MIKSKAIDGLERRDIVADYEQRGRPRAELLAKGRKGIRRIENA
jgi:hypothetical protein